MRGFRVYDKQEHRMIDTPAFEHIFLSGNGNLVNVEHPEIYLMDRYIRIVNAIIIYMDSTGLSDKNGKEIYKWDIIKYYTEDGIVTAIIIYEENDNEDKWISGLSFKFIRMDDYEEHEPNELEVIGNIYSNPELLKTK